MADRLTLEQRRRNMSAIQGKNTSPELIVRKLLHRLCFRYKLHDRRLPGTPQHSLAKISDRYYGAWFFLAHTWVCVNQDTSDKEGVLDR